MRSRVLVVSILLNLILGGVVCYQKRCMARAASEAEQFRIETETGDLIARLCVPAEVIHNDNDAFRKISAGQVLFS